MEIEAMAPATEEVEEVVVDMVEGMQVSGNISTSCLTSFVLSIMHIVVLVWVSIQIWSIKLSAMCGLNSLVSVLSTCSSLSCYGLSSCLNQALNRLALHLFCE